MYDCAISKVNNLPARSSMLYCHIVLFLALGIILLCFPPISMEMIIVGRTFLIECLCLAVYPTNGLLVDLKILHVVSFVNFSFYDTFNSSSELWQCNVVSTFEVLGRLPNCCYDKLRFELKRLGCKVCLFMQWSFYCYMIWSLLIAIKCSSVELVGFIFVDNSRWLA